MRTSILFIATLVVFSTFIQAQTPQAFQYQAALRNEAGNILVNQPVSFKISILSESPSGVTIYEESHNDSTNEFGLVTLEIGSGIQIIGDFSLIPWGDGTFFLQVSMDETGGTNYQLMGASQLLSVPYALHAATALAANQINPFLLPRMTTTERDALSPIPGMLIFNTDVNNFQGFGVMSSLPIISQTDSTSGTCPSIMAGLWIVYQSFTTPSTTDLTEVVISIENDSPVPGLLEILSGDGTGGAVLYSENIIYPPCGGSSPCDFRIPLTTPLSLMMGSQYTLKFSATAGTLCCKRDLTNPYTGGIMYQNNTAQPGNDIYFILIGPDDSPFWGDLYE